MKMVVEIPRLVGQRHLLGTQTTYGYGTMKMNIPRASRTPLLPQLRSFPKHSLPGGG